MPTAGDGTDVIRILSNLERESTKWSTGAAVALKFGATGN